MFVLLLDGLTKNKGDDDMSKTQQIISEKPLIVGCSCGKKQVITKIPDPEYGQNYCTIECECGYYWEGYMGAMN